MQNFMNYEIENRERFYEKPVEGCSPKAMKAMGLTCEMVNTTLVEKQEWVSEMLRVLGCVTGLSMASQVCVIRI